jgi:hypothetical protein
VTRVMKLTVIALATAALAGCGANSERPASSGGSASATPSLAEQACLRDVTKTTNNPDVVLLDSTFSEAGTEVIVGVGPQRARWRCIGYSDGTTAGIMSLTDEGRL